jgi:hypothetical protein
LTSALPFDKRYLCFLQAGDDASLQRANDDIAVEASAAVPTLPLLQVGLAESIFPEAEERNAANDEDDGKFESAGNDYEDQDDDASRPSSRSNLSSISSHKSGSENHASSNQEPVFSYEGDKDADGNPHGFGTCSYGSSGARYQGEWKHGEAEGKGRFFYPNGSR